MGAVRLTHIGLCVADAERATGFYRDALGFREVSRLSASGAPSSTLLRLEDVALEAIYLERDGVRIELTSTPNAVTISRPMSASSIIPRIPIQIIKPERNSTSTIWGTSSCPMLLRSVFMDSI